MPRSCLSHIGGLAVLSLLLVPGAAFAQSAIAGVVKDTTGAVLPGVTVEATSPVLIEKTRIVVSNEEGLYRVEDLRPGVYTVTFTLTGFAVVIRQGVQLPASFTATVNADLRVGTVSENITVTGAAPTVDVHTSTSQQAFSQPVLEALPSLRSPHAFAKLATGISTVPLSGEMGDKNEFKLAAHGGRVNEAVPMIDGASTTFGPVSGTTFRISQSYVQEVNVLLLGASAEFAFGGVVMNVIPKEGGNRFSGSQYVDYAPGDLQSNNLSDALKARGLASVRGLVRQWDVNTAFGGPILRNRMWFFASGRNAGLLETRAGVFENLTPLDWVYTPDLSRPAPNKITDISYNGRLTWQATPKNKIGLFIDSQPHTFWNRNYEFIHAPEATTPTFYLPNAIGSINWKLPASNRLLFESGARWVNVTYDVRPQPGVTSNIVSALETSTGRMIRAASDLGSGSLNYSKNINNDFESKTSVSYVTGTHTFKSGVIFGRTLLDNTLTPNGDIAVSLRNGIPISLKEYAGSSRLETNQRSLGLFAQDGWTLNRLTLNLGLRYDHYNAGTPAMDWAATSLVPAHSFPAERDVPDWNDLSARLGASYDLFGDGKTALKASLGRYVNASRVLSSPAVTSVTRSLNVTGLTWTDASGDFFPNCDLGNPQANGACGRISDLNFGLTNPNATKFDDEVLHGYGVRPYNWASSVTLQREVSRYLSLTGGYYRRWYGNFTVTQNVATTPADFDPYCITAPASPGLPNGGGYQVCGLYDVKPELFGRVANQVRLADHFGRQFEHYNGFDLSFTAKLPHGIQLAGGANTARIEMNSCFVVNAGQDLLYCDIKPPFQTNAKLYGVVPLPAGIQVSGVYQRLPAPYSMYTANTGPFGNFTVTYLASNAQIAPSLGRNLSSGAAGTVNVAIVGPGQVFLDPSQQLDLRVSKLFKVGRVRILGSVDFNNALNANAVQAANLTFGPSFQQPTGIQQARYVKFSTQIDF